jgi:hypothetical protein
MTELPYQKGELGKVDIWHWLVDLEHAAEPQTD